MLAMGVDPTNDGLDVGMMQDGVHRFLISVDDVEHTIRAAGFARSSQSRMLADGSFSDGEARTYSRRRAPSGTSTS
jgi:hypothetical protein